MAAMRARTLAISLGLLLALGSGQREPYAEVLDPEEAPEREDLLPSGACRRVTSCKECILSHPRCAWCKQLNFTALNEAEDRRCAQRQELLARGCPPEELEEPRGRQEVLQDEPLGHQGATQLAPQNVRLQMRLGETQRLRVRFRRVEGYPVDLYYLMDLSYSMKDDLERVRQLGHSLLNQLRRVTSSVRIGFGSFVDKTVLPFVSTVPSKLQHPCPKKGECQPPFSFRHVLPLTDNASAFKHKVEQQNISGNLDSPEGGF